MGAKEIAIIGNGPGSIAVAHELAIMGHAVDRFMPENAPTQQRSIYSTSSGLTADVVNNFCTPEYRRPLPVMRIVISKNTDFRVFTGNDYFMVDYPRFVDDWNTALTYLSGVNHHHHSLDMLRGIAVSESHDGVNITIDGGKRRYDAVIDSTGAGRHVTKMVHPENRKLDHLVEYVYAGQFVGHLQEDEMILVWDRTGSTSWINPSIYTGTNGEPLIDIVYSAWGWNSQFNRFLEEADQRLDHLVSFAKNIDWSAPLIVDTDSL